ncbi:alanine--tRNA ligase, cytoplasmic-like [Patiria miniata]|uniref:Alanine--tRNA ligase n=1 Tax=Patiria miniata TaxID=46514 RepID=A0A913ZCL8_PATMI|nr:alanine--tRNA ligase, cytoplasmic-like [Patiria miniata]XP_038048786.1 alanine--tRNA ligase, cytoplasmic-like [Patiria miniata]
MVPVATFSRSLPLLFRFCKYCSQHWHHRPAPRYLCNGLARFSSSESTPSSGTHRVTQRTCSHEEVKPARTVQSANEIRQTFIEYFRDQHGHTVVPSASVIPQQDRTLLFTNAGMNQFKDIFQGTNHPHAEGANHQRVVNSQKCIRAGGKHNDLDDVGRDVHHHTFFEMLGNWSFGDYFKREACCMAWDLLTRVYGIPKDQLYVTYFKGDLLLNLQADTECRDIWIELGVPPERVLPSGMADNFWEMGGIGPCGPCSEIHYDRHGNRDASKLVNDPCSDVLEVWNLVFMEYNRQTDGSLKLLPQQHVDAGMGLERLVAILQGVESNYETDLFLPLLKAIENGSGSRPYSGLTGALDSDYIDTAYRVVADHARMLTVAIADGGQPDYFKRGYVLKRVVRRAVRYATEKLHAPPGLLASLVPVVIDSLGSMYPELRQDPQHIMDIISAEEHQFLKTLKKGQKFLSKSLSKLPAGSKLSGDVAWKMYDGYGFPLDLTTLVAEEHGIQIDMEGYEGARLKAYEVTSQGGMKNLGQLPRIRLDAIDLSILQRKKVKFTNDSPKYDYSYTDSGKYVFPPLPARVLALKTDKGFASVVSSGEECGIVLDCTNFYAEQGGQEWDEGHLNSVKNEEVVFQVENVQLYAGYVLHVGTAVETVKPGDNLMLFLNKVRRQKIMRNHTATHILNFALREVLGDLEQRGSLVAQDRLRFDFTAKAALDHSQLQQVTQIVNDIITKKHPVYRGLVPLATIKTTEGVRAVFEEAYTDPVTVVSVAVPIPEVLEGAAAKHYPVELCGGNHVCNTGHIKKLLVTAQRQVSAGVRRLTAITGNDALSADYVANTLQQRVTELDSQLKSLLCSDTIAEITNVKQSLDLLATTLDTTWIEARRKETINQQIHAMREKVKQTEKMAERSKVKQIVGSLYSDYQESSSDANVPPYLVRNVTNEINSKLLLEIAKELAKMLPDTPLMLISGCKDDVAAICMVPKTKGRLSANAWMGPVMSVLQGKGGGSMTFARSQGKGRQKVRECLSVAEEYARFAICTE